VKRAFVARVFIAGDGLERARQLQDRGKLFRAFGAVPAGANRPGVPGRFAPVGQ
jgi:hypothetical protein